MILGQLLHHLLLRGVRLLLLFVQGLDLPLQAGLILVHLIHLFDQVLRFLVELAYLV